MTDLTPGALCCLYGSTWAAPCDSYASVGLTALPAFFSPLLPSLPLGFSIYFGYGLWHSEEANLAAGPARTPDSNLNQCK